MMHLPNVSLIMIGEQNAENAIAYERCCDAIDFADRVWLSILPSYEEYNRFIICDLHKHFTTSHCLIIQGDGFIWNAQKWTEEFLSYDYIGAAMWNGFVGNGGFSLRSKKLCEATEHLFRTNATYREMFALCPNEDQIVSIAMRADLQRPDGHDGCRFAPSDIADAFSWELSDRRPDPLMSFGIHGKITLERARALGLL